MGDLIQAAGYAAIVYLLFNYMVTFGSGRPLVEWINPGRRYLPLLAGVLIGGAYTSLTLAHRKYHLEFGELLRKLVSEEKAPPEVVGAVSFVIFAAAIMLLASWCWMRLPRGPGTFSPNPKDLVAEYRRACRHYVRWHGGLDFAMLCEVRDGQLQEIAAGADDKNILRGLHRLPGLHATAADAHGPADVTEQKAIWRTFALNLFNDWPKLNEFVYPTRHGKNVAVSFDLRYGALFVEMIEEEPAPPGGSAVGIFLFAAALNQYEVNTLSAAKHFSMLSQAVRHIRTGVAKG